MKKQNWIWMPHAGHFILGSECRFRLNTYVGKYIVSTVGEYFPDSEIREIKANTRKIELEGIGDNRKADYFKKIGYEEIGLGRKYETMVFKAKRSNFGCCSYEMISGRDLDMAGYNNPDKAYRGHFKLCKKWSKK